MKDLNYDKTHILPEHQKLFEILFKTMNLEKVVFVGGIADYLNLRHEFDMPINDIDLCFRDTEHIKNFSQIYPMRKYPSVYTKDALAVYTGAVQIAKRRIHFDLFQQPSIFTRPVSQSELLGRKVLHTSFEGMRDFHNEHVGLLSSEQMGHEYEWKRLYKHSRKAALYNMITYKREKQFKPTHEKSA